MMYLSLWVKALTVFFYSNEIFNGYGILLIQLLLARSLWLKNTLPKCFYLINEMRFYYGGVQQTLSTILNKLFLTVTILKYYLHGCTMLSSTL